MKIKFAILTLFLLWVTAWLPNRAVAHCPGEVPKITLSNPRDGVAIQTFCFDFLGACYTDTFYREVLHKELVDKFNKSSHVVFGFGDSLVNFLERDTAIIGADVYYDTIQMESLWVSVETQLKGALPSQKFIFRDRFDYYVRENRFATTYTDLLDTPFVAFFDTYADVRSWGVGPKDGCFFEPTAYMIIGGRIHKRSGREDLRMPGVSVAVTDFLKAVGLPNVKVPEARPRRPGGIRPRNPGLASSRKSHAEWVRVHDLRGRRLGGISIRTPETEGTALASLPMGWYILQWQGPGWSETRPVFFPGGESFAAFLGLLPAR